ncbi:hypothetical protein ACFYT4_05625 [Streptomyces sp. NPDC004609]|uniref:hypothetical protein n=1 Tax=Streptomyces sp. NPDC004609 TaxID=3364704 RepID=UPI0036A07901
MDITTDPDSGTDAGTTGVTPDSGTGTTRRNLLRGLAVAPLAAAAGGLFTGTAEAAPGARLVLRPVTSGVGGSFRAAIRGLSAAGLPPAGPTEVLGDLDRAGRFTTGFPNAPTGLAKAFTWDERDVGDTLWYPQGITGVHDAAGTTGDDTLLVSWYGKGANYYQGSKVTFVDANGSTPRYRHVLLVEPRALRVGPSTRYTYEPVEIHAGGIAWYRHRLYVADSGLRALRVFDTDRMFRATGFDPDLCGLADGRYHAFNNGYVLPQSRIYRLVGPRNRLKFSQVALDRTTTPHSLVVSEFHRRRRTDVVRWNLNPASRYGLLGSLTSRPAVEIDRGNQIQGAVSADGTYYLSVSNGGTGRGHLKTARPRGHVAVATSRQRLPVGPEDVSYQDTGGAGRIWSLNEYPLDRYVYAINV